MFIVFSLHTKEKSSTWTWITVILLVWSSGWSKTLTMQSLWVQFSVYRKRKVITISRINGRSVQIIIATYTTPNPECYHLRLTDVILTLKSKCRSNCILHKNYNSKTNSLFIQENSNDDADYEDHSQDWAHHPYESVTSLYWANLQLGSHHSVGVRAGSKHFLHRKIR